MSKLLKSLKKISKNDVEYLQSIACDKICDIMNALGIDYCDGSNYMHAPCPVHGGDNPRGFYWSNNAKSWQCITNQCEHDESTGGSNSVFGLIRGVLSRKLERSISFYEAIDFVKKTLNLGPIDSKDVDNFDPELDNFILKSKKNKKNNAAKDGFPLWQFKNKLNLDTVYYNKRGVSRDIIEKYYISFCDDRTKEFYNRAFFPILDYDGINVLGWSGRTIWNKCDKCQLYHDDKIICPDKRKIAIFGKWKHSKGFKKDRILYNIWFAKNEIRKTQTAIICEGPGDVWSLEQAGVHNSVSIMGISISDQQRRLLQKSGALTLIMALDGDDAGNKATDKIIENLNCFFRIKRIKFPNGKKDFGDMAKDDIRRLINANEY